MIYFFFPPAGPSGCVDELVLRSQPADLVFFKLTHDPWLETRCKTASCRCRGGPVCHVCERSGKGSAQSQVGRVARAVALNDEER